MAHKLYKETNEKNKKSGHEWTTLVGNCYLIYIFGFLPLIMRDGFFDITRTKYLFFAYGTVGFTLLMAVFVWRTGQHFSVFWKSFAIRIYVLFLLAAAAGAFMSAHTSEAFNGSQGRYRGVYEFVLYLCVFFIICYTHEWYRATFYIAGGTAFFVFLLGILNCFYFDPLHTFTDISLWDSEKFISTIGQIDLFGEYCGIILSILIAGLCLKQAFQTIDKIFWSLLFVTGTVVMLCNNSDAGHFAVMISLVLALLFVKDREQLLRICYCMILFGISLQIWKFFPKIHPMKSVDGINGLMTDYSGYMILIIVAAVMIILFSKKYSALHLKRILSISILVMGCIGGIYILLANLDSRIPIWEELKWGPEWGSKRGALWIASWDIFKELPLKNKLFGVGADTLIYYYDAYQIEQGFVYDSAHNCILQLLLGVGLLGTILWLAFFGSVLYMALKRYSADNRLIIPFIVLISYFAMSMIGIQICFTEIYAVIMAGVIIKGYSKI